MKRFRRLARLLAAPLLAWFALGSLPGDLLAAEEHPLSIQGIPTNLGLAHEMCRGVAEKTLDTLAASLSGSCLHSQAAGEHSGNGLVQLALDEAARRRGLRVSADGADCAVRLEFHILDLRIAYTGVDRSAVFVKKEIERSGTCVLATRLVDAASGTELATAQEEVLATDRVPYDLRDLVRSESYPFTQPELKEKDWSKSVEPFVVTALISSLVYLFFSNQSSD
jgi:hypothetical protein